MGVSGRGWIVLLLIIIIAASAAGYFIYGTRKTDVLRSEDLKFVEIYTEMSVAREMAGRDSLLLDSLYSDIYDRYNIDSTWLLNYVSAVSGKAEKQKMIWDAVVARLDSLKTATDSTIVH